MSPSARVPMALVVVTTVVAGGPDVGVPDGAGAGTAMVVGGTVIGALAAGVSVAMVASLWVSTIGRSTCGATPAVPLKRFRARGPAATRAMVATAANRSAPRVMRQIVTAGREGPYSSWCSLDVWPMAAIDSNEKDAKSVV